MKLLMQVIAIWGLLDSVWMASKPEAWGRFWRKNLSKITSDEVLPRVCAVLQVSVCLWLLSSTISKKN